MTHLEKVEIPQTGRKIPANQWPQAVPGRGLQTEDFAEIIEFEEVKTTPVITEIVVAAGQVGGVIIIEVVKVVAQVVKVVVVGVVELSIEVVKVAVLGLVKGLLWRDPPADNDWPTKARQADRPNVHIVNNVSGATGDVTIVNNVNT